MPSISIALSCRPCSSRPDSRPPAPTSHPQLQFLRARVSSLEHLEFSSVPRIPLTLPGNIHIEDGVTHFVIHDRLHPLPVCGVIKLSSDDNFFSFNMARTEDPLLTPRTPRDGVLRKVYKFREIPAAKLLPKRTQSLIDNNALATTLRGWRGLGSEKFKEI